jgi:hypothetical protein
VCLALPAEEYCFDFRRNQGRWYKGYPLGCTSRQPLQRFRRSCKGPDFYLIVPDIFVHASAGQNAPSRIYRNSLCYATHASVEGILHTLDAFHKFSVPYFRYVECDAWLGFLHPAHASGPILARGLVPVLLTIY